MRRTTAKLCRAAGGELEQIQLLLGHSSVQTTERYLGTKQDLVNAPNDGIKLRVVERILRTAVQWRKISFGNRSHNGELATARLLTVTQTCKRQQRHVLGYLTDAVRCHRRQAAASSLLPQRP